MSSTSADVGASCSFRSARRRIRRRRTTTRESALSSTNARSPRTKRPRPKPSGKRCVIWRLSGFGLMGIASSTSRISPRRRWIRCSSFPSASGSCRSWRGTRESSGSPSAPTRRFRRRWLHRRSPRGTSRTIHRCHSYFLRRRTSRASPSGSTGRDVVTWTCYLCIFPHRRTRRRSLDL